MHLWNQNDSILLVTNSKDGTKVERRWIEGGSNICCFQKWNVFPEITSPNKSIHCSALFFFKVTLVKHCCWVKRFTNCKKKNMERFLLSLIKRVATCCQLFKNEHLVNAKKLREFRKKFEKQMQNWSSLFFFAWFQRKKKQVLLKLRPTWMYHFPNAIFYSSGSQSSDHIVGIIFLKPFFERASSSWPRRTQLSVSKKNTSISFQILKSFERRRYEQCMHIHMNYQNHGKTKYIYVIMKNISVVGFAKDVFK